MLGCKGFIEGVNPKKKRKQFVVKASNAPFEKLKERLPWRYIKLDSFGNFNFWIGTFVDDYLL